MDGVALARIVARRRRLESVLLAAFAAGCGPEDPVADTGMATSESVDDGIVVDTGTETGTGISGDPQICLAVIDAVAEGDCIDPLGYRWTTGGCAPLRGCACVGTECELLYETKSECEAQYLHCDLCDPCPDSITCVVHCTGVGFTDDISCGDGCWEGEQYGYPCPMDDLEQPASVDLHCSGLGRVVLPRLALTQLAALGQPVSGTRRPWRCQPESATSSAAQAWARICACERASVAGFERLAKQLEALGAPAELIEHAERFAADERRHAAATLAIARRFDPEIQPPRLPPEPSTLELAALLEETILAGCIGETLSALELEHMLAACSDEPLASVLAEIADDEARHAEHAWVLLAWLLRRFPALRDPAMQMFRRECATVPLGLDRDLPEFALLADGTRAELWDAGRRHVVDRLAAQVCPISC
jgi:rubrerythrin